MYARRLVGTMSLSAARCAGRLPHRPRSRTILSRTSSSTSETRNNGCPPVRWWMSSRHRCRKSAAASVAQISGDRGCRQRVQHQLRTMGVRPQIGEQRAQWMCAPRDFGRSVGAENQDVSRITLARHICQPRQRRPIAPVQVFEDEDERASYRERLQRIGQLPQHLRRGDAVSRAHERGSVGRIEHRGQVREPARSIPAQSRRRSDRPQRPGTAGPAPPATGDRLRPSRSPRRIDRTPTVTSSAAATCATNASTSAVLPIPGSPTMNPTCRRPCCAVLHH